MRIIHQICITKKDLKYNNPKGDVLKFLTGFKFLFRELHKTGGIAGKDARRVAVDRMDVKIKEWMERNRADDKKKTLARYRKRYKRGRNIWPSF